MLGGIIKKTLAERIVEQLGGSPGLSAAVIKSRHKDMTIQAVYKALRLLIAEGVVVKVRQQYFLNPTWLLNVQADLARAEQVILHRGQKMVLPQAGKPIIWKFNNVIQLNDWWAFVLLYLVKVSGEKKVHGWNPHPWFHLAETEKESRYIKALGMLGARLYLIIGGNSFLDQWAAQFWPKSIVRHSSATGPMHDMSTYINIVGDYLVKVTIGHDMDKAVEQLFNTVRTTHDISLPYIAKFFYTPCRAKLVVEYNPRKVVLLRRKLEKFWGEQFT